MKIINTDLKWNGSLSVRQTTTYIVLHHRAGDGTVESIHKQHQNQGWAGIGYHYYIRKDGTIYTGRPLATVGAHTTNYNEHSIGVCFEGDYSKEDTMPSAQFKAGNKLLRHLSHTYPHAVFVEHNQLQATACPGEHFPFQLITRFAEDLTVAEAIDVVKEACGFSDKTMEYFKCYKYDKDLVIKLAKAILK